MRGIPSFAKRGAGIVALVASSCVGSNEQVSSPVVLGMTESVRPDYQDETMAIYRVGRPVSLPVRPPRPDEVPAGRAPPYPRPPYLAATHFRLSLHFTISNLDARAHGVELLIDPWNEFVRYRPGVTFVGNGAGLPDPSGIDRRFELPPLGRAEGVVTQEDIQELSTDLATAQSIFASARPGEDPGPLMNRVFSPESRPAFRDPITAARIPETIAGLTGFDLGLRTHEPANVSVEVWFEIEDLQGDRILSYGSADRPLGPPTRILSP